MKELEEYPTVETLETDQLIDLKTKVSLATFVKLSEVTARKRWKRGVVVETALREYLDKEEL